MSRLLCLVSVVAPLLFAPLARGADEPSSAPSGADAAKTPKPSPAREIPDQETLNRAFEEKLSGAALVGSFTTAGAEDQPLKPDRYVIEKVEPLDNDRWRFVARIQYDGRDLKVPLALDVKWAGDTPVITLTNMLVPGFGTFSARVLFYGDQYAGTWSAGDHGGHMFGRIEKLDPAELNPPAADSEQPQPAAADKSPENKSSDD